MPATDLIPLQRSIGDTKRVLTYYRPSPDGKHMIFGGRARFTAAPPEVSAPILYQYMIDRFPQLKGIRITHVWTGNVAFALDSMSHMGQDDGMHYLLACNGSGVAMMTYLGTQTAKKIAGGSQRAGQCLRRPRVSRASALQRRSVDVPAVDRRLVPHPRLARPPPGVEDVKNEGWHRRRGFDRVRNGGVSRTRGTRRHPVVAVGRTHQGPVGRRAARRRRRHRGNVQAGRCRQRRGTRRRRRGDPDRLAGLRSQARLRQDRAAPHAGAHGDRELARLVRRALPVATAGGSRRRGADRCLEHHAGERPSDRPRQGAGQHGAPVGRSRHGAGGAQRGGPRHSAGRCSATGSSIGRACWRSRSAISIRRPTWASRSAT